MDVEQLIQQIQARTPIWDQKNSLYHNRELVAKLWEEVAATCELTVDNAKAKWKNLRDGFRSELKKMAKGAARDAEGGQTESSWVWYKSLLFLKNQVSSRKMRRILPKTVEQMPVNEDSGTQSEVGDDGEDVQPKQYCITALESPSETENLVAKKVRTKNPEDAILDLEIKKFKMIESHMEKAAKVVEEDDNYHFLMCLKKPLSCLSMDRQMFVRYKIQELIYSEISNISKTPTSTTNVHSP